MKKKITIWLTAMVLIFQSSVSFAQDETPTPEPPPDETIGVEVDFVETGTPFDDVLNNLASGLAAVLYVPSAVGFVTVLTSVSKRFVPFSANLIALFWMAVMWAVFALVKGFGFDPVLAENVLKSITELGYVLLAATGTQVASGWWYQRNKDAGVPIVGFSKSGE